MTCKLQCNNRYVVLYITKKSKLLTEINKEIKIKFTPENVKCAHRIKCVKVRALFAKNKVRFARAEQL